MHSSYLEEDLHLLAAELHQGGFGGSTMLITGATGLLGSLTVKAILAHNRSYADPIAVLAFARSSEKAQKVFSGEPSDLSNVRFFFQDITAPIPAELSADYVLHTASITASQRFLSHPVEVLDGIYTGTKQLLDFAKERRVSGMVYLSSMEVFGKVTTDARLGEDALGSLDLRSVRSCYPEGKRAAELLCTAYAKEYGVPVRIARLAQTFGAGVLPSENRVFAQFAKSALRGENLVLHTRGRSVGNYCYTRDVLRAVFLLLRCGESGEAYTVVNEETTCTIAEMAKLVAATFSDGCSSVVFDLPEGADFGYAPDTQLHLCADKLRALGWTPEVSLSEMYRRMLPDLHPESGTP